MTPKGLIRLKEDEGCILDVYNDLTGQPLGKLSNGGNPTIGYGRNLNKRGITSEEATYLLNNDLTSMWSEIIQLLPWVNDISFIWQDVILMVEYNTGDVFSFRLMLSAMKKGDAVDAAFQLMNSKAAVELPTRYGRMRNAIINNYW